MQVLILYLTAGQKCMTLEKDIFFNVIYNVCMCSRSVSTGNLLLIDCWNCLCHFFEAHCIILCVGSSPQSSNDVHMTNQWDQGGMSTY